MTLHSRTVSPVGHVSETPEVPPTLVSPLPRNTRASSVSPSFQDSSPCTGEPTSAHGRPTHTVCLPASPTRPSGSSSDDGGQPGPHSTPTLPVSSPSPPSLYPSESEWVALREGVRRGSGAVVQTLLLLRPPLEARQVEARGARVPEAGRARLQVPRRGGHRLGLAPQPSGRVRGAAGADVVEVGRAPGVPYTVGGGGGGRVGLGAHRDRELGCELGHWLWRSDCTFTSVWGRKVGIGPRSRPESGRWVTEVQDSWVRWGWTRRGCRVDCRGCGRRFETTEGV